MRPRCVVACLKQACLRLSGCRVADGSVPSLTISARTLTHPKPEKQHKHMTKRGNSGAFVIHSSSLKLLSIPCLCIPVSIAGICFRNLHGGGISSFQLAIHSGENKCDTPGITKRSDTCQAERHLDPSTCTVRSRTSKLSGGSHRISGQARPAQKEQGTCEMTIQSCLPSEPFAKRHARTRVPLQYHSSEVIR